MDSELHKMKSQLASIENRLDVPKPHPYSVHNTERITSLENRIIGLSNQVKLLGENTSSSKIIAL